MPLYLIIVRHYHTLGEKKPSGYTENPTALTGRKIGAFTTLGQRTASANVPLETHVNPATSAPSIHPQC